MGNSDDAPAVPKPKSSTYNINGQQVATQTPDASGNYTSNVTLTPYQNSIYDYANKNMTSALQGINTLDPATQQSIENSAQAAYNNGLQQLNYNSNQAHMNNMNDVSRRLGTLDTSILSDMNQNNDYNYNQGLASLSNNYINNLQNYKAQALGENQNFYNALLNGSNNVYNQANGYNTAASGLTSASNNIAQQQYQDALTNYAIQQSQNQAAMSYLPLAGMGGAGMAGGLAQLALLA